MGFCSGHISGSQAACKCTVGVGVSILQLLSISLTKEVQARFAEATEVFLVTLALLIAVENLSPPEFAGGFPR
jgi:hypothetical protein